MEAADASWLHAISRWSLIGVASNYVCSHPSRELIQTRVICVLPYDQPACNEQPTPTALCCVHRHRVGEQSYFASCLFPSTTSTMSGKTRTDFDELVKPTRPRSPRRPLLLALCTGVAVLTVYACNIYLSSVVQEAPTRIQRVPRNADELLRKCASLKVAPGPRPDFYLRDTSDRFEPGTPSTLIKDAHIWTGARNGTETITGDVLLSGGVVKGIGYIPRVLLDKLTDLVVIEANGGWVTPGLGTCISLVYCFSSLNGQFHFS